MAVTVRLRRMGSNKQPFFRIVATDQRFNTKGRFLEILGWYDPQKDKNNCEINLDRLTYWQESGARVTDTIRKLAKDFKAAPKPEEPKAVPVPAPEAPAELAESTEEVAPEA